MTFLLAQLLLHPERVLELDNAQLNVLLSQGRNSRLLGSLAFEMQRVGADTQLPQIVDRHFQSARLIYEKQNKIYLMIAKK